MGEIADSMINGEVCSECGVYLEPRDKVYQRTEKKDIALKVDNNGIPFGFPVVCLDCYNH